MSALLEILFAARPRYDSMPKLVLHSSHLKFLSRGFSQNGAEALVERPWHTRSLDGVAPDHDLSTTARVESHARPRERSSRERKPARGLVIFRNPQRIYRSTPRPRGR